MDITALFQTLDGYRHLTAVLLGMPRLFTIALVAPFFGASVVTGQVRLVLVLALCGLYVFLALTFGFFSAGLVGIFSGDPKNEDVYTSTRAHAIEGRAVAVVRTDRPGTVKVVVRGGGLRGGAGEAVAE